MRVMSVGASAFKHPNVKNKFTQSKIQISQPFGAEEVGQNKLDSEEQQLLLKEISKKLAQISPETLWLLNKTLQKYAKNQTEKSDEKNDTESLIYFEIVS